MTAPTPAQVKKGKLLTDLLTTPSPFVLIFCFFLSTHHSCSTYLTSQSNENRQGSEELAGVSLTLFKTTLGKLALGTRPQGRTPVLSSRRRPGLQALLLLPFTGQGDKPEHYTLPLTQQIRVHPRPFKFLQETVFQIPSNSRIDGGSASPTAVGDGSTASLQDFLSGI